MMAAVFKSLKSGLGRIYMYILPIGLAQVAREPMAGRTENAIAFDPSMSKQRFVRENITKFDCWLLGLCIKSMNQAIREPDIPLQSQRFYLQLWPVRS